MGRDKSSRLRIGIRTAFSIDEVLSFIFLVLLIAISVRYCDLHDYRGYYLSYTLEHKMAIEVGYTALAEYFYYAGFPFYVFYGLIVSISMILMWKFFKDYGKHQFLLLLIFLIYPYINTVQQIRSLLGAAIVMTGLRFILSNDKKVIPFIITVLIAMLFHTTSFVYLIFLWAVNVSYERIKRICTAVLVIGLPILLGLRIVVNRIFPLIPYFSLKYLKYINEGKLLTRAVIVDWVIFLLIILGTNMALKNQYYALSEKTQGLVKVSYVIFALSILRGLGNNGYRIALMMYPVFYVMMDNVIYEIFNRTTRLILKVILVLFPIVSVLVWWGPPNPPMFEIVKTEMWRVWDIYYH